MDANAPMEPVEKLARQPWHLPKLAKSLALINSLLTAQKGLVMGKNYSGLNEIQKVIEITQLI